MDICRLFLILFISFAAAREDRKTGRIRNRTVLFGSAAAFVCGIFRPPKTDTCTAVFLLLLIILCVCRHYRLIGGGDVKFSMMLFLFFPSAKGLRLLFCSLLFALIAAFTKSFLVSHHPEIPEKLLLGEGFFLSALTFTAVSVLVLEGL